MVIHLKKTARKSNKNAKQNQAMKKLIPFCLILFSSIFTPAVAQTYLPGLWSGELTQGTETYRFEIFIKRKKQKLTGRTYLYLSNNEVVTMEFRGVLHNDLSMNIYEMKMVEPIDDTENPIYFPRTFQLLYNRKMNSLKMTGYWQEMHISATDEKRRFGRVFLSRTTDKA